MKIKQMMGLVLGLLVAAGGCATQHRHFLGLFSGIGYTVHGMKYHNPDFPLAEGIDKYKAITLCRERLADLGYGLKPMERGKGEPRLDDLRERDAVALGLSSITGVSIEMEIGEGIAKRELKIRGLLEMVNERLRAEPSVRK